MRHLEEVMAWADNAGPGVSPAVEFQLVFNRRAAGIFSHGIEVLGPVLAESWSDAREAVALIDNSPLRKKASLTLPLIPMSLGLMMKTGEKTLFLPNTRWTADSMWMNDPIDPLLPAPRKIADNQPASRAKPRLVAELECPTFPPGHGFLTRGAHLSRALRWAPQHGCIACR